MKFFITENIRPEEIELKSKISICDDQSTKNWIYKGSLGSYLASIPDEFESLIPLKYYSKNALDKKKFKGEVLFESRFSLESASEVINKIAESLESIDLNTSFDDLKHYITLVGSELVRNGIILNLKKKEEKLVSLSINETDEDILIRVVDCYGELECSQITKRLKSITLDGDYERKENGAGLGLFMVIKSVDTIEFKVNTFARTEVLCSISKYKRLKHFKEKETTLFFEKKD